MQDVGIWQLVGTLVAAAAITVGVVRSLVASAIADIKASIQANKESAERAHVSLAKYKERIAKEYPTRDDVNIQYQSYQAHIDGRLSAIENHIHEMRREVVRALQQRGDE